MIYGFIDESGAPGVATNEKDFLVVSLILFMDLLSVKSAETSIRLLRQKLNLKETYEFHCSHNASWVRNAFLKLLVDLDFCYITVAIKKTRMKKNASYSEIAKMLAREVEKVCDELSIEMDSNPLLHKALKTELKQTAMKYSRIREVDSRMSDLVQVADYVVNLAAKEMSGCGLRIYEKVKAKQVTLEIKN